jgi:hypothetical protein
MKSQTTLVVFLAVLYATTAVSLRMRVRAEPTVEGDASTTVAPTGANGPRATGNAVTIDMKGVESVPSPLPPPKKPCNDTKAGDVHHLTLIPEFKPVYVNSSDVHDQNKKDEDLGRHTIPEFRSPPSKGLPHHKSVQKMLPVIPEVRDTPSRECANGCAKLNITRLEDGTTVIKPLKPKLVKTTIVNGDEIVSRNGVEVPHDLPEENVEQQNNNETE